jgi:NTP pyrophosphatase (non-canonical NTP hydrolase)
MKIKELIEDAHQNAKDKGFWDKERDLGQLLMLIVTKLAEALEADREGRYSYFTRYYSSLDQKTAFEENIKDTFEDEIADCFIRLADLCGGLNIDIEKNIIAKMEYNESRESMHGKKY